MNVIAEPAADLLETAAKVVDDLQRLRPEIERTLEYTRGTHTMDDIVAMVLQGRVRMWVTEHSFLIVERVEYPRQVHYHIFLAGGDLDELRDLHDEVIAAAKADQACKLTITGRKGWVRALKAWGWTEVMTTVELEV